MDSINEIIEQAEESLSYAETWQERTKQCIALDNSEGNRKALQYFNLLSCYIQNHIDSLNELKKKFPEWAD